MHRYDKRAHARARENALTGFGVFGGLGVVWMGVCAIRSAAAYEQEQL